MKAWSCARPLQASGQCTVQHKLTKVKPPRLQILHTCTQNYINRGNELWCLCVCVCVFQNTFGRIQGRWSF